MSFDPSGIGYSRSALFGAKVVWLLEIDYAGTIWRWSSAPITVVDADGASVVFDGGLEDQRFDEALAIAGESADDRSASFELFWPGTVGVAVLVARGHDLATSLGELSILVVGQAYETRQIVVSGRVSQPEYGALDEPVAFSLIEQPYDDLATIIPASQTITLDTWPTAPASGLGRKYPAVFAGIDTTFDTAPYRPRSPAYAGDIDASGNVSTLIVAGGMVGTSVTMGLGIYVDEILVQYEASITYGVDDIGQRVSTIDISTAAAVVRQAGAWYVYSWSGGGYMAFGAPISTAGQLLRYLASRSSVRTDAATFASLAPLIDWPIDCYVDDESTCMDYVLDQLLAILPVSLVSGPDGLSPVLWRYDASRAEAVETITAGPGISRVDRVKYDTKPRDLIQRIELSWGHNCATGDFEELTILEPTSLRSDPRSVSDVYIRRAGSRYADSDPDRYRTMRISSALIQSPATASRVVHWMALKHGYSPRSVQYDVGQEYGWLGLGAVVIVVDSEVSLDAVALVVGRVISDSGTWRLTLQILDDSISADSVAPSLDQTTTSSWPGTN